MKLVFIFGKGAVGKMTVGQELMKITDLRLFHNHMTIEPVIKIFGRFEKEVSDKLRQVIFEEFAKSDLYGLIFTYIWAFDSPSDWEYLEKIKNIFKPAHTEFYYVELTAPLDVRLKRNATENRLSSKASKRDIEASNQRLLQEESSYRLESYEGEIKFENYIRIDNSHLSAELAAKQIKEHFNL